MIIIQGSREHLDVDEITKEVERISASAGHVFKGIVVKKGRPKVLSVFTLASAPELEGIYAQAARGMQDEKEKRPPSSLSPGTFTSNCTLAMRMPRSSF